jgi:hypothetical protein
VRLTTLNRYLKYLPGNAAEFSEEELKDMLVDLHSPSYQRLMARANYDMDTKTFLQVTQYLQNLSLIEESFKADGNKHHGNSEAKAHKKGHKNRKFKHGKEHCRKHPEGDHTWANCYDNPKNPKYKGNRKANNNQKKAEARNIEVDSDADMDKQLNIDIVNIDEEEVSDSTIMCEVLMTDTNSTPPSHFSPVNVVPVNVPVKKCVTFAVTKRIKYYSPNVFIKQRLSKHVHNCYMQTPLSRKLQKVEDSNHDELTTEVSALIKNVVGQMPTKLTRVLIDTGCSKTLIKRKYIPSELEGTKKSSPTLWNTNGGKFATKYEIPLTIILPEFSSSMEVQWSCAIDENPDSTYDMIIGRDLQSALKMDISFSTSSLIWNEIAIPMRTGQQRSKEAINAYLDNIIETSSEPEILREEL